MNKKVIVLNGAARKNGSTAKLVEAFCRWGGVCRKPGKDLL